MKKSICCMLAFCFFLLAGCSKSSNGQSSFQETTSFSFSTPSSSISEVENLQNNLILSSSKKVNCYQLPGASQKGFEQKEPHFLADNSIFLSFSAFIDGELMEGDGENPKNYRYEYLQISADGQQELYRASCTGISLPPGYPGRLPILFQEYGSKSVHFFQENETEKVIELHHIPTRLSLSPDQTRILYYTAEDTSILHDIASKSETRLTAKELDGKISARAFLNERFLDVVLSRAEGKKQAVLDLISGEIVAEYPDPLTGGLLIFGKNYSLSIPGGISDSNTKSSVLCDVTTDPPTYRTLDVLPQMAFFSENGAWIGMCFFDDANRQERIAIYDSNTFTLQWEFSMDMDSTNSYRTETCKAVSNDGNSIVLANGVDNIYLIQKAE